MKVLPLSSPKVMLSLGYKRYYADPVKLRFLISTSCRSRSIDKGLPRSLSYGCPCVSPLLPGSPSIGSGSFRQDRCSGLPHCRKGSTTPLCVSRLHLGSLALRPAGLLDSLKEPLSGNSMLQVTLYTSLQLHGRTTELPPSDLNRLVTRFTRHTLRVHNFQFGIVVRITV
jgi:hypothetical protein